MDKLPLDLHGMMLERQRIIAWLRDNSRLAKDYVCSEHDVSTHGCKICDRVRLNIWMNHEIASRIEEGAHT